MKKKDVNFEINLLPVISLLAVCISFLLLTAVWVQIGTLNVKQALGDSSSLTERETPAVWVILGNTGDVIFQLKNIDHKRKKQIRFMGKGSKVNWKQIEAFTGSLRKSVPNLSTALVFPDRLTAFDDVIKTVDLLKRSEISDVGIAPL